MRVKITSKSYKIGAGGDPVEGFEKTQKHDQIKNKYCTDNNINIIRLTYDDLNNSLIEWTLDNELNKRNKLSKIGREVAVLEL